MKLNFNACKWWHVFIQWMCVYRKLWNAHNIMLYKNRNCEECNYKYFWKYIDTHTHTDWETGKETKIVCAMLMGIRR